MAITRVRPTADVVLYQAGHRYTFPEVEDERLPSGYIHSYPDSMGQSRFLAELANDKRNMWPVYWRINTGGTPVFVDTALAVPQANNAWMCRPFLDAWQAVRKADFWYAPDGYSTSWEEVTADVGLDVDYEGSSVNKYAVHMLNSTPNQPPMQAMSKFALPVNPFFCVSLWRNEPHADHKGDAYTSIIFGYTGTDGYALHIPFREPATLQRYSVEKKLEYVTDERGDSVVSYNDEAWTKLEDSEQSLQIPSMEGLPKGERVFIWFGVIGGKIAVSTDGFQKRINLWGPGDDAAENANSVTWPLVGGLHSQGETQMPTVFVPEGPVVIEGRGCEFGFSFFACRMFNARMRSPWISALYNTQDAPAEKLAQGNTIAYTPWMPLTSGKELIDFTSDATPQPLVDIDDTAPVRDENDEEESYKDWFRQWTLLCRRRRDAAKSVTESGLITANDYDPTTGSALYFYRSPQLSWVTYAERVLCTAAELAVDTDLTEDDVPGFGGSYVQGSESGRMELVLDNQLGQQKARGSRRYFELSPGWVLNNSLLSVGQEYTETQLLFGGTAVEPVLGIEGGGRGYMTVPLQDDFLRLGEMKVDGRVPAFDEWEVREAVKFALSRCGIPDSKMDLEDTGKTLPGSTQDWLHAYGRGRLWSDVLFDLCFRDYNAALWFEPDGTVTKSCRFCRVKRNNDITSEQYWGFHKHYNDSGCLSTDLTRNSSGVFREYYTRGGKATDPETGYGECLHLEGYSEELPGLEFATWVQVSGKDVLGRPVTVVANGEAAVRDPTDARYTGGHHIMDDPHEEDAILTLAQAANMARLRLHEVYHVNDFVRIRTPLDQAMRRGYTFQVAGGEHLGLDAVTYRCVSLIYDFDRRDVSRPPATNVIGRRLSHADAPALPS